MEFISNAGTDRVLDFLRPALQAQHRLDMASPAFSLFAFSQVLNDLPKLSQARLVIPPITGNPITGVDGLQLGLLGSTSDRAARNKLLAPWLARQLAHWVQNKADVRHSSGPIPQGTVVMRDAQGQALQAALGSFAFSSEGLGITPGNPLSLIQASETSAEAQMLSQWFDTLDGGQAGDVWQVHQRG